MGPGPGPGLREGHATPSALQMAYFMMLTQEPHPVGRCPLSSLKPRVWEMREGGQRLAKVGGPPLATGTCLTLKCPQVVAASHPLPLLLLLPAPRCLSWSLEHRSGEEVWESLVGLDVPWVRGHSFPAPGNRKRLSGINWGRRGSPEPLQGTRREALCLVNWG